MILIHEDSSSSPEDIICSDIVAATDIDNNHQNVTVKFHISDTQTIAQIYPITMTLAEVKNDIALKFDINAKYLQILQTNKQLSDLCQLSDTLPNEFGIIEFDLQIDQNADKTTEDEKSKLDLDLYYSKFRLTDFITVHISAENASDGIEKDVVVEIQNQAIVKPFLGGFKDLKTGIEYLDGFTQTGPALHRIKTENIFSRDVQTVETKDKMINTTCDEATQSFGDKNHLFNIPSSNDHIIIPRKYESIKDRSRREYKEQKIILIQRNWRRYLLWRYIKNCATEHRHLVEAQKSYERKSAEDVARKRRKECIIKVFPKSKEDFDLLYAQVQKWKDGEIRRINSTLTGALKTAELGLLLDKEIQLLNGIEYKKNLIRKALIEHNNEKKLKKLGEPIKWIGYRDIVVEMDLLRTQRVRFLTEFYKEMKKDYKAIERIELLNKISNELEKEDVNNLNLVYELLELFEREKNLILLLNNKCSLDVLRKRQLAIFMKIIENYKYEQEKREEKRMCEKCKKIKSINQFALRTRQDVVDTCKRCFYLKQTASDNSFYKAILRAIQRDERKKGTLASYAFIMQEDDIRYIIDVIWHGHSILSKSDDMSSLRLPRWIKNEEWSPWNCVCLTEQETRAHANVKNLEYVYHDSIIQDVKTKHIFAKNAFKKLKEIDHEYVESGEWWDVGIKEKIV